MKPGRIALELRLDGRQQRVELEALDANGRFRAVLTGSGERKQVEGEAVALRPGVMALLVEGRVYRCVLEEAPGESAVRIGAARYAYQAVDPRSLKARRNHGQSSSGPRSVKAPMPGRIVRVLAAAGEEVAEQQGLVVIEAMKMQNELRSPKAGRVAQVLVAPGATVAAGQVLVLVE